MDQLQEAVQRLYKGTLQVIEDLMALDPPVDSPEGRLLADLTKHVMEYEKSIGKEK